MSTVYTAITEPIRCRIQADKIEQNIKKHIESNKNMKYKRVVFYDEKSIRYGLAVDNFLCCFSLLDSDYGGGWYQWELIDSDIKCVWVCEGTSYGILNE